MKRILLVAAVLLTVSTVTQGKFAFGNYFANWAQYRMGDFSYKPQQLQPAVDKFDYVVYAFAWINGGCNGCHGQTVYDEMGQCQFPNGTCSTYANGTRHNPQCPVGAKPCTSQGNFTLLSPEPADPQFYQQVVEFKQNNPGLKVLLSVGGWNFPSSIFSELVANPTYRQTFIKSCQDYMDRYNFDGIDIDWEFWGSGPRGDNIKLSNASFHILYDVGGDSGPDGQNLLSLVTEMRQAFGNDKLITLATQADLGKMKHIDIKSVSDQIDYWHLMAYDYSVSDLPEMCGDSPCFANFTAPNQPLYAVKEGQIPAHDPVFPSSYWSVNYTIQGYINAGAPPESLILGLTFYGHHWYIPNQSNWQRFGVPAAVSHGCYGPFNPTFGAWPGRRARLCGLLIYSEIVSLIDPNNTAENYFDEATQSDIGYITSGGPAGENLGNVTPAFVSWNSIRSLKAITEYAMEAGIGGVFAFDASMDVFEGGEYPVVNAIYNTIQGGASANICDPTKGCNVCPDCCKSYLKNQQDCDACVKAQCPAANICNPDKGCNVCDQCCKSYISDQQDCDACVQQECKTPF